jgi:hypothetical protein
MWHRLSQANRFFLNGWAIMAYQPVLYFFVFSASIRLWHDDSEPPNFKEIILSNFYGIWLFLGVASPLLLLLSWFFIKKLSGTWSFIGMWVRLAADIGMFTNILAYHIVTADSRTEAMIFSRYVMGATLVFVLMMIVRDIWTIVVTEKIAGQLHSETK